MQTRTIKHETAIRPYTPSWIRRQATASLTKYAYFQNQPDGGELILRSVFPNYIAVILVINIRRFLSCIMSTDILCSIINFT